MAKCPKCGAEVVDPVKSWSMIGKPDRSGEIFKLTLGLYKCTCSDNSFRSVIGKEKITLRGVFDRNYQLEEQLMEATSRKTELEGILKGLEEEKIGLLAEVEALRAIPMLEKRLSTLEWDILQLREEKKTLMDKLTILADATPIDQPNLAEKPLEDYLSESATTAPIVESQCECATTEFAPEETTVQVLPETPITIDHAVETNLEKTDDIPQVDNITAPIPQDEVTIPSETLAESPNNSKDDASEPTLEILVAETTLIDNSPTEASSNIVENAESFQVSEVAQVQTSTADHPAVEPVEETPLNEVQNDEPTNNLQELIPPIVEHIVEAPQEIAPVEPSIEKAPEIQTETVTIVATPTETVLEIQAEASHPEPVESQTSDSTPVVSYSEPHVIVEKRVEIAEAEIALSNDTTSIKLEDSIPKIEAVSASVEILNDVTSSAQMVEEKLTDAAPENTHPILTDSIQAPSETPRIEIQVEEPIKSVTRVPEPIIATQG